MRFRLNKIQVEDDNYQTDQIELVNISNDKKSNHISLIVGNNGTGKSRLLGSIARVLNGNFKSKNNDLFFFSHFETENSPSKLISVSNSLSDKFPMDNSYRFKDGEDFNYREERYNYLGTRGRMGASSRVLIRRAIDILLENYANKNVSKCYRHVFDYLDYQPVIKLEYTIIHRELTELQTEEIQPHHLINYINKNSSYSGLNKSIFNTIEERYSDKFLEICSFLNMLRHQESRKYELEIDFSTTKINRIVRNNKLYEEDLRIYEILNILRKLNMIRGFDVNLVKKGDRPFNFTATSSGEANILTTLIALIPLVEDNCCVLIDEPELSLHPSWQYRYIELLNKIFDNFKGCHIIIASHSHFIVSDLPTDNSSVIILKKESGTITSKLLPDSTFGWSAEDILLNVFEMPTTRNYYVSNLVTESLELIGKNKKKEKRFIELRDQLSVLYLKLKEQDPLKLVISSILKI
ncbi:AAA family ATPase [Parasediminibacterium sp. JCM 36343]|uniref:AAA family ATPase n=1 Tax=Parasediminibacterium sp. JCM 36343 TaxID=3374279 RepID=UPI00397AA41B